MKWIDLPPVWLAAALGLAWSLRGACDLSLAAVVTNLLAGLLVGAGIVLIALAIAEMVRWRTTLVPRRTPKHLITSGIYGRSRNPIYLGDSLILLGMILYWDAPLALPIVPIFMWWLERHFIVPEENLLRRTYRLDFARYIQRTRRWL